MRGNLARAGHLDMGVALQTVEYLDKEIGYVPWRAAKRELGYVNDMLSRTELYGQFQVRQEAKKKHKCICNYILLTNFCTN